jgi:cell division protein FtsQ
VSVCGADGAQRREPGDLGFAYRSSNLGPGEVVSRASFLLEPGDPDAIKAELASMRSARHEAQPSGIKTFGSTFTNPPPDAPGVEGRTAGQLLEAAGCRGLAVGGAKFSDKHANFVENSGDATTADVLELMAEGRRRVHERFGVVLEPEVQVLGEGGRLMASRSATAPRLRLPGRRGSKSRSRARNAVSRVSWLRRLLALAVIALALAAGYFFWLRDSSLVAVDEVKIKGLTSLTDPDAAAALESAAGRMTTLHVELDELGRSVAGYPTIKSLSASPSFPNGLEITVVERPPVAVAGDVPVAADGTLLPDVDVGREPLPAIDVSVADGGGTLDGAAREQAVVMGAAPEPLVGVIERSTTSDTGIEVELTNGIMLRFGDAARAEAKWEAAARILADPGLTSLTYIDLRIPDRPAVGGGVSSDGTSAVPAPG